jgi:hypothetical protein
MAVRYENGHRRQPEDSTSTSTSTSSTSSCFEGSSHAALPPLSPPFLQSLPVPPEWRMRVADPHYPVGQARLEALGVLACEGGGGEGVWG